ncbi:hypothetical protein [Rhodococcus ruber]|uniref:hypothetical protein n=1 Tax=Rhodococcus ruber TaxID=1830 RepID=UPI00190F8809|nr:hypothetical protein [Rhodococcus ruber]
MLLYEWLDMVSLTPANASSNTPRTPSMRSSKVIMQDGGGLTLLGSEVTATIDHGRLIGGDTARYAAEPHAVWNRIVEVTAALWSACDTTTTSATSSVQLEAFGYKVIAEMGLEQITAVAGEAG